MSRPTNTHNNIYLQYTQLEVHEEILKRIAVVHHVILKIGDFIVGMLLQLAGVVICIVLLSESKRVLECLVAMSIHCHRQLIASSEARIICFTMNLIDIHTAATTRGRVAFCELLGDIGCQVTASHAVRPRILRQIGAEPKEENGHLIANCSSGHGLPTRPRTDYSSSCRTSGDGQVSIVLLQTQRRLGFSTALPFAFECLWMVLSTCRSRMWCQETLQYYRSNRRPFCSSVGFSSVRQK